MEAIKETVVTGAAGFIGSTLVERLVGEGWRVTGVDAFTDFYPPDEKADNLAVVGGDPHFDLVTDDVATAPLARILRRRPVVVHLAAQAGVRSSFGPGFEGYLHHNLLATHRLLAAALEAGCPRVVHASSSSVYGDCAAEPRGGRTLATTATRPRSPYGVTKLAAEHLAGVYQALGLRTVGLRFFTVYGPRQRPDMAVRRLCEAALGGAEFPLKGDGRQSRDLTYVDDAVDATVRAMTCADAPPVLDVGGVRTASLAELVDRVESLAGRPVRLRAEPAATGDVRRTLADTRLAREVLGWRPRTDLPEGLRRELDWVRSRRGARPAAPAASRAV